MKEHDKLKKRLKLIT
jgi:hypothetical protein